jgi:hypothetical protein
MICYLGLALLAGVAVARLAKLAQTVTTRAVLLIPVVALALLIELHAFPLDYYRGEVDPDSVTLHLKKLSLKGGLVELPSGEGLDRHRYMLRAADHGKPLVNATASFISPLTAQINSATAHGPIADKFMDLLENVPTSYLVVHNTRIEFNRKTDYETFLAHEVAAGRLRFINRFDGRDDLYAVTKTEPQAVSEAPAPDFLR